jgi:hypothetical protein
MKRITAILVIAALTTALFWHLGLIENLFSRYETRQAHQHNETSFQTWLKTDPARARDFAALSAYLKGEDVGDVVPVWSLTRADDGSYFWCKGEAFGIPPRASWPHIVPALRIVRDRVIPVLGRVEVRSVYRSASLNTCVHGAPQSRHLSFSAIDLVALDQPDSRTTFTKLCAAWAKAGPKSGWGLGAYFDPAKIMANRDARFHVDGTGWRSWGYSKKAASSGCRLLSR